MGFEGGETELEIDGPGAVNYKGSLGDEGGEGWLVEAEVRVTENAVMVESLVRFSGNRRQRDWRGFWMRERCSLPRMRQ